eukprot:TRINITY_DN113598_c0_g1_i1.p1 TRINITY_DN113598_c0_g1~~TRINITY_DN113598_c0_g1_i1.p1  ORF type:complete len:292 (-),score=60.87 TRINITY_DN113598_c0_g1_i1:200-1075(-)
MVKQLETSPAQPSEARPATDVAALSVGSLPQWGPHSVRWYCDCGKGLQSFTFWPSSDSSKKQTLRVGEKKLIKIGAPDLHIGKESLTLVSWSCDGMDRIGSLRMTSNLEYMLSFSADDGSPEYECGKTTGAYLFDDKGTFSRQPQKEENETPAAQLAAEVPMAAVPALSVGNGARWGPHSLKELCFCGNGLNSFSFWPSSDSSKKQTLQVGEKKLIKIGAPDVHIGKESLTLLSWTCDGMNRAEQLRIASNMEYMLSFSTEYSSQYECGKTTGTYFFDLKWTASNAEAMYV